ncbi:hypothetical protein, partial [Pseudomonas sp. O39]|uniref:hypothetical protein n=1 Tax=Pseudomonas sp. O39 TaxID=3379130 RepID=UPI00387AE24C
MTLALNGWLTCAAYSLDVEGGEPISKVDQFLFFHSRILPCASLVSEARRCEICFVVTDTKPVLWSTTVLK